MDEQALNRKLAEYFLWGEPDSVTLIRKALASGGLGKGLNFAQSLDACFKWLVPKLFRNRIELTYTMNGKWRCVLGNPNVCEVEEAETPPLALCLAIEKLIDER